MKKIFFLIKTISDPDTSVAQFRNKTLSLLQQLNNFWQEAKKLFGNSVNFVFSEYSTTSD